MKPAGMSETMHNALIKHTFEIFVKQISKTCISDTAPGLEIVLKFHDFSMFFMNVRTLKCISSNEFYDKSLTGPEAAS